MRFLLLTTISYMMLTSAAMACNFNSLSFGQSVEQIASKYQIEVFEADAEGEFIISEMGDIVCDELPKDTMIEFTFVDDTFIKTSIRTQGDKGDLLNFAQELFGESDDKDRKKAADDKTRLALWNGLTRQSMIYTTHVNDRGEAFENLSISSKLHKSLFEKTAKQQGKQLDDYLKANKLGKYSTQAQQNALKKKRKGSGNYRSPIDASSGASSNDSPSAGGYDANALDRMKENYEKSQDAWKKRNESNKKGR